MVADPLVEEAGLSFEGNPVFFVLLRVAAIKVEVSVQECFLQLACLLR